MPLAYFCSGLSDLEFNGTQALYALFAGSILTRYALKKKQGLPICNHQSNFRIKNLFHEIKVLWFRSARVGRADFSWRP